MEEALDALRTNMGHFSVEPSTDTAFLTSGMSTLELEGNLRQDHTWDC